VGASAKALIGAAIGGFIGIFFGLPGILLGPFIGAIAGELMARGGWKQATKVGVGTALGLLFAAVAKDFDLGHRLCPVAGGQLLEDALDVPVDRGQRDAK
jgi:uncharacterized protein YqgC (DUF456 family)